MRLSNRAAALFALLLAWCTGAMADEPRHRDGRNARAPDRVAAEPRRGDHRVHVPPPPMRRHAAPPAPAWRGDLPRFRLHDAPPWRSGRWHHGWHDGRVGWWWIVGSLWTLYPERIHPDPEPYPPAVVVEVAPDGQYWYYCPSPAGYYPEVPVCDFPWEPVPAQ